MDWSHIPDMDTSTNTAADNPFAKGQRLKCPVKCRSRCRLTTGYAGNCITLVEGYPSEVQRSVACRRTSFLDQQSPKPSGMGCILTTIVTPMLCQPGTLTHHASTVVSAGLLDRPVCRLLHPLPVVFLKRTYLSGRSRQERLLLCVVAAGFNGCLFKVQQDMQSQLKTQKRKQRQGFFKGYNCQQWTAIPHGF